MLDFEQITSIVVSRLRGRPWTWEPSDVYNMVYVIAREAAQRYEAQEWRSKTRAEGGNNPWALRPWVIETTYSCARAEYEKELQWAQRRLPNTERKAGYDDPLGPLMYQPGIESVNGAFAEEQGLDWKLDLYAAIDRLPPEQSRIMKFLVDGWSFARICKYISRDKTTVNDLYQEALPKLKEMLDETRV